jgi:hypothetical protein
MSTDGLTGLGALSGRDWVAGQNQMPSALPERTGALHRALG